MSWCFCPQIKHQLFIRWLVDQTCYHLALQTHGRRGTEAKDMEMDQRFRVDTFCFELTDINPSSRWCLLCIWHGLDIPQVSWITWLKICQHIKSNPRADETAVACWPLIMWLGSHSDNTLIDCVVHKHLTLQTCQEYADVSNCTMQMQYESLNSNLKIRT